jgi:MFS superfamily sulfate permease-like transporter
MKKLVMDFYKSIEERKEKFNMYTALLVVLVLVLLGALPTWPYSRAWGYYPSGLLTLVVIVLLCLLLTGRL